MFPVLFAIPRTSGWIAQWLEMIDDDEQKIARPRRSTRASARATTCRPLMDQRPAARCRPPRRGPRRPATRRQRPARGRPMRSVWAATILAGPARRRVRPSSRRDRSRPSEGRGLADRARRAGERRRGALAPLRGAAGTWSSTADGADPVPARKAMALVRVADPQLPFVRRRPVAAGRPAAFVQGFGPEAILAPDPRACPTCSSSSSPRRRPPRRRRRAPAAARPAGDHRPRRGRPRARRALRARARRRSARRSAGPTAPSGARRGRGMLRCAATWHDPARRPGSPRSPRSRAGPGSRPAAACPAALRLPPPVWVADVGADGNMPPPGHAVRAG